MGNGRKSNKLHLLADILGRAAEFVKAHPGAAADAFTQGAHVFSNWADREAEDREIERHEEAERAARWEAEQASKGKNR